MKPNERDELLIRMDERVYTLTEVQVPAIEKRLDILNDQTAKNTTRSVSNKSSIMWIRLIGSGAIILFVTVISIICIKVIG